MNTNQTNHDVGNAKPVAPFSREFWARIRPSLDKKCEERRRRRIRNQRTFTVPETAKLTGLSLAELWQVIEAQAIEVRGDKFSGWYISKDEACSLVHDYAQERNCQAGLDYLAVLADPDEDEDEEDGW